MCSPMSAKATISSRLASISAGASPSSAAARSMLSSPEYSGWKPGPQLEQRSDAPAHAHLAAGRRDDVGDDLEQRRLARAVLADDAERLARGELERNVVERAEHVCRAASAQQVEDEPDASGGGVHLGVVLPDAGQAKQRRAHQTKSSKCGESRRKTHRPAANKASATSTATASPHCSDRLPSSSASRRRPTR